MITTVLIFIIVLGLLIFVHELGHFLTARALKMKVEEFGFGFPPKMIGKRAKSGTEYSLNWIPIGGFVKIKGENGENRLEEDSFGSKKAWQRAIVLVAGVAMNFLLCAFLLTVGYLVGLPQAVDQEALDQGLIKDYKIQIISVLADKPAQQAGIELGDVLLSVDNQEVNGISKLVDYTSSKIGQKVTYQINRNGQVLDKEIEVVDIGEGKGGIGVGLVETGIVSYPVHLAVWHGFGMTGALTKEIFFAFGHMLKSLVIGRGADVQVSGPIGIAVLTGQVAKLGFIYILQFTAILSLNLAIINILPIPALDGGRLLFLAIEKIRRKPVDQRIESIIHTIGFALLMLLIIVVTFQDIIRYSGFFTNLFAKIIQ